MGESTVIAHALLTIVAITMASVFAGVVIFGSYDIGNSIQALYNSMADRMRTDIVIAYISFDPATLTYYVYAKNTGSSPINSLDTTTIFFGPEGGVLDFYTYDPNGTTGTWYYVEHGTQNQVWEVGEVLEIVIVAGKDYGGVVKLVMVVPTGAKISYVEPIG
ncbi:MAG: flagellin [Aeropyrum sp.]|nr:flagellin [Aeropyrum sp.]MCE4616646.1 flagellin [Aeropyrum sp.]